MASTASTVIQIGGPVGGICPGGISVILSRHLSWLDIQPAAPPSALRGRGRLALRVDEREAEFSAALRPARVDRIGITLPAVPHGILRALIIFLRPESQFVPPILTVLELFIGGEDHPPIRMA